MKMRTMFLFVCLLAFAACKKVQTVTPEPVIINDNGSLKDTALVEITLKKDSFCLYPHAAITFSSALLSQYVVRWIWLPQRDTISKTFTVSDSGSFMLCVWSPKATADTFRFSVNKCNPKPQTISLYVPNSFTPNNDGVNDTWGPKGTGIASIYIEVRNEDGIVVFTATNLNDKWDGKWKGTNTVGPSGFYIYYIDYTDINGATKKLTGSLELQR